jgi:hemoglobin-like flavoprotein
VAAVPKRLYELTDEELPPFTPGTEDTPGTVELIQESIKRLPAGNQRILTDIFYEELFSMAPETESLFPQDMNDQKDRLLKALLSAARHMTNPASVESNLRIWGVIHRRQYGITDEMYVYVGHALVRTMSRLLTNDSTLIHSSWVVVYQWMAAVMIDGAEEADYLRR